MKIKISLSNSAKVCELEQIYKKLWGKEPSENADLTAAREYWSQLNPRQLAMELKQARLKLKVKKAK